MSTFLAKQKIAISGHIIAIEGIDGAGKSTQIDFLRMYLSNMGVSIVTTGHGQTPHIRKIFRKVLNEGIREKDRNFWSFLLAADYAWRVNNLIYPALERGEWVLADRYLPSVFTYEAARGVDLHFLEQLYKFVPPANCTILIDIDPEIAQGRISHRLKLDATEKDIEFLNVCRQLMFKFVKKFDGHIVMGNQEPRALFAEIKSILEMQLDLGA